MNRSMECNTLDLPDQFRMTKQLCKSLDTRIMDFGIVNCGRCIKEQNITIKIEKCAKGVDEVVFLDEELS